MAEQQNTRRWEHARPPETPQGSSRPEPGHHQLLVAPTLPWVSTRPPLTKRSPPKLLQGVLGFGSAFLLSLPLQDSLFWRTMALLSFWEPMEKSCCWQVGTMACKSS